MRRRYEARGLLQGLLFSLAALAAVLALCTAVARMDSGRTEEGARQLEEAIRRAAVTCYAGEGVYPPTLDYLREHYGIQVDGERYAVIYDVYAENLMPDIVVLQKGAF